MIDKSEQLIIAENMMRYGGSFVKHLGEALMHADPANTQKIKNTWSDCWEKYLNIARKA